MKNVRQHTTYSFNGNVEICNVSEGLQFVRSIVLDALELEVCRRLGDVGMVDMEHELARDLEHIATAVSHASYVELTDYS